MSTHEERARARRAAARGRQVTPKKSFPWVPVIIGLVAVLAIIAVAVYATSGGSSAGLTGETDATPPGAAVETLPTRNHTDQPVQYNTNPPTSGDHSNIAAQVGFYANQPPSDGRLVHSLEHGNVVMYWNPQKLDEASFTKLKALYDDLRGERPCIILAQRTNMDHGIALTAWGFLAELDTFDEGAIRAFWKAHVAQGPEFGPGQCG